MDLPSGLSFAIEDDPSEADLNVLPRRLEAFNESQWPGHQAWQPIGVFARDRDDIVAGLGGHTYCGWLFVMYLWVSKDLRGHGVGSRILASAENHALQRGCHSVWLDTFSFQAPSFYGKLGYQPFGELDYPPEHKRFFLWKPLRPSAGRPPQPTAA